MRFTFPAKPTGWAGRRDHRRSQSYHNACKMPLVLARSGTLSAAERENVGTGRRDTEHIPPERVLVLPSHTVLPLLLVPIDPPSYIYNGVVSTRVIDTFPLLRYSPYRTLVKVFCSTLSCCIIALLHCTHCTLDYKHNPNKANRIQDTP